MIRNYIVSSQFDGSLGVVSGVAFLCGGSQALTNRVVREAQISFDIYLSPFDRPSFFSVPCLLGPEATSCCDPRPAGVGARAGW